MPLCNQTLGTYVGSIAVSATDRIGWIGWTNADFVRALRQESGTRFGLPATNRMLEVGAFFMRTETELVLKSRRVARPAPRRRLSVPAVGVARGGARAVRRLAQPQRGTLRGIYSRLRRSSRLS